MLVGTREMLIKAQANGYTIGAFNTNNLEITLTIMRAAEAQNVPDSSDGFIGDEIWRGWSIDSLSTHRSQRNSRSGGVNLDHAKDFDVLEACVERGFTCSGRKLPSVHNPVEIRWELLIRA